MTAPRPDVAACLDKIRGEIADLSALVSSAHRLVGGLLLTGDPDDAANDEDAIDAARGLLGIARRTLRYLSAEIDEQIAEGDSPTSDPSE